MISKQFHKTLAKQGIKFKLGTKVVGSSKKGDIVEVQVEAANGGKPETVSVASDISDVY